MRKRTDLSNTPMGRVFDVVNFLILGLIGFITLAPFIYILAGSFATEIEITTRSFFLIPKTFSLDAYKFIFSTKSLSRAILNTVGVTVIGTIVQLFFTLTMAYPLSRKHLKGRSTILKLIVFAMIFSGGMIPTYLIVRSLGLLDSYWSLILPVAINPFNLLIIKNSFQEFPNEIIEATIIDGCTEIQTFLKVVLPLSMPIIATFTLFYAVSLWNDFFNAFLYITDSSKWTLQVILRQITLMSNISAAGEAVDAIELPKQGIKFATIAVATLPILCIYPFLQKHFSKGMMMGAVKG